MFKLKVRRSAIALIAAYLVSVNAAALAEGDHQDDASSGHAESEDHDEEETNALILEAEAIRLAGIKVEKLRPILLKEEIAAPGEVELNAYLSSQVTPRIEAQIIERHARLGDHVEEGQPLVTLSSVEMADAVGDLLVTRKEWMRLRQLSDDTISSKRKNEARIAYEQAFQRAAAYGLANEQLEKIKTTGDAVVPSEFQLLAPQGGTVVSDGFVVGELIEPGRVLFNIVDETEMWVEARLPPAQAKAIEVGARARVEDSEGVWLEGAVLQKHHMLDETTRTIAVRIGVDNEQDRLHPGMYVDARIEVGGTERDLAVPTEAVLKSSDGDWIVFVEMEPGKYEPREIDLQKTVGDYAVIAGLAEGEKVVTFGAFYIQSELAKSGYQIHNH